MALGVTPIVGEPTGPETPPRYAGIDGGMQSPTEQTALVRYPPPIVRQAFADAAGAAVFLFEPVSNGEVHELELIRVVHDGAATPVVALFESLQNNAGLLDKVTLTAAAGGGHSVFRGNPSWRLAAGSFLVIAFSAMTPATSVAQIRVQYRVLNARS